MPETTQPERYFGAGPWPDGQFYVWDRRRSAICNPDTGSYGMPWRRLGTATEASDAAMQLNQRAAVSHGR